MRRNTWEDADHDPRQLNEAVESALYGVRMQAGEIIPRPNHNPNLVLVRIHRAYGHNENIPMDSNGLFTADGLPGRLFAKAEYSCGRLLALDQSEFDPLMLSGLNCDRAASSADLALQDLSRRIEAKLLLLNARLNSPGMLKSILEHTIFVYETVLEGCARLHRILIDVIRFCANWNLRVEAEQAAYTQQVQRQSFRGFRGFGGQAKGLASGRGFSSALYHGQSGKKTMKKIISSYTKKFISNGESRPCARKHAFRVYGGIVGNVKRRRDVRGWRF